MTLIVTTIPGQSCDPCYLVMGLRVLDNSILSPSFLYRFDPLVEVIALNDALSQSRTLADIAAQPGGPVLLESVVALDAMLPSLPTGWYEWLGQFFSGDLQPRGAIASVRFTFE
jgi:hypothetical protein